MAAKSKPSPDSSACLGFEAKPRISADSRDSRRQPEQQQSQHCWGSKVIARIADDLKAAFPEGKIKQQPVAQLLWSRSLLEIQIEQQLHLRLGKARNKEGAMA